MKKETYRSPEVTMLQMYTEQTLLTMSYDSTDRTEIFFEDEEEYL